MDWVVRQDGGQPIAEATAELIAWFPDHEALIRAFYERWREMAAGVLDDGVAIMEKLEAAEVPLFGLTNWSAETFPYAWENYPVLRRFRRHHRVGAGGSGGSLDPAHLRGHARADSRANAGHRTVRTSSLSTTTRRTPQPLRRSAGTACITSAPRRPKRGCANWGCRFD